MREDEFLKRYPRLFHMAESGAWPQIQRHGLLSTSALLDLFEIAGEERFAIESMRRSEIVEICHSTHGRAQIRDNKPLREQFLRCLPGTTPQAFLEMLNGKVFFWVSARRLETLLGARAYCRRAHDVLILDTGAVLARHRDRLALASINTGSTLYPTAPPRGRETFASIEQFDWEASRRSRGVDNAVVEVAIEHSLPNVEECLVRVERRQNHVPTKVIWRRARKA